MAQGQAACPAFAEGTCRDASDMRSRLGPRAQNFCRADAAFQQASAATLASTGRLKAMGTGSNSPPAERLGVGRVRNAQYCEKIPHPRCIQTVQDWPD